jgi:hypothetical protein
MRGNMMTGSTTVVRTRPWRAIRPLAPAVALLLLTLIATAAAAQIQYSVPPNSTLSAGSQLCLPVIGTSYYYSTCGNLTSTAPQVRWQVFWGKTAAEAEAQTTVVSAVKSWTTLVNFSYINNPSLFPGYFMACVLNHTGGTGPYVTFAYWSEQNFECISDG